MRDTIVMYGMGPDMWPQPIPEPFSPPSFAPFVAPLPVPPVHVRSGVLAGVEKLLPALREHLRARAAAGQPLDAEEAMALVWLEGLTASLGGVTP
jgi:hypothetical protein